MSEVLECGLELLIQISWKPCRENPIQNEGKPTGVMPTVSLAFFPLLVHTHCPGPKSQGSTILERASTLPIHLFFHAALHLQSPLHSPLLPQPLITVCPPLQVFLVSGQSPSPGQVWFSVHSPGGPGLLLSTSDFPSACGAPNHTICLDL